MLASELYNKTCTEEFYIENDDYMDDTQDYLLKVPTASGFLECCSCLKKEAVDTDVHCFFIFSIQTPQPPTVL